MARHLSFAAIKSIHAAVDVLFDKAKGRFLGPGALPRDKRILLGFEGFQSPLSLPGVFSAASREEAVLPNDEAVKALMGHVGQYLEAYRAKTKAEVVKRVQAFLQEAHLGGVKTDVSTVLGGELADVWKKTTQDVHRLVETETTSARNLGTMEGILKINASQGIEDPVVYFVVVRDQHLCTECKRLHLREDGITPRVWRISELGHGYHKRGQAAPKVSGLHPHCRCTLVTLMPGYGFDGDGMVKFISPDHDELERQRGGLAKGEEPLEKSWAWTEDTLEEPQGYFNPEEHEWVHHEPVSVPLAGLEPFTADPAARARCGVTRHGKKGDPHYPRGRPESCDEHIAGLAAAIKGGQALPPILLEHHPATAERAESYRVVDGNHRIPAALSLGLTHAPALIMRRRHLTKTEEALAKSDWPTSKYLAELERFGWYLQRDSKHAMLTNRHFSPTRPLSLKHSEMRRIGIENMENSAKEVGLIWDYDGLRPNPKHPYAVHYRKMGHLPPDPNERRTWTPDGHTGEHIEIGKVLSTKPDVETDWRTAKFKAHFAQPTEHGKVPAIRVMDGGDGNHYAVEGDEQLEAARAHGMTHVPVIR